MSPVRCATACALFLSVVAMGSVVQPPLEQSPKKDCCAHMKGGAHCGNKSAPAKPEQDQCCGFCVLGLAVISDQTNSIQSPPLGDEFFANFVMSERSRSDRPLVPPPRV